MTVLNLNIIQENECIVEKDYNGNSKENIEPNPISDTPFYVKKIYKNNKEFGPIYIFSILSSPIIYINVNIINKNYKDRNK